MASVNDILSIKGSQVHAVDPDASVLAAANLMNEHKIGGLVVFADGKVQGIVTERDILRRVVVKRLDPSQALVREVMTTEVICGQAHTSIEEAKGVMKNRRFRHLPIVDHGGQLCGMISIGDLNAYETHAKELTIHLLEQYISGPV